MSNFYYLNIDALKLRLDYVINKVGEYPRDIRFVGYEERPYETSLGGAMANGPFGSVGIVGQRVTIKGTKILDIALDPPVRRFISEADLEYLYNFLGFCVRSDCTASYASSIYDIRDPWRRTDQVSIVHSRNRTLMGLCKHFDYIPLVGLVEVMPP